MDKIQGMIYGAMYGDALGTPYEFSKTRPKLPIKLKQLKRFDRFQNHWKVGTLGIFSDDTEMALILFNHLVEHHGYSRNDMLVTYMKWANSKIPFLGRNTRALLKGVTTIPGYNRRYEKIFPSAIEQEKAQSNGSLMRCYPFAFLALHDPNYEEYLEQDCRLTNPCTAVIEANKQYIKAMVNALRGATKEEIIRDYVWPTDVPDVTVNKGWYVHALYCAYAGLRDFNSYDEAIQWIIGLGGDTDTNASIAGALLGAYYGIDVMRQNPEFCTNLEIIMNRDPQSGGYARPVEYGPTQLTFFSRALDVRGADI